MVITKKELDNLCVHILKCYSLDPNVSIEKLIETYIEPKTNEQLHSLLIKNDFEVSMLFNAMVYMQDYPEQIRKDFIDNTDKIHLILLYIKVMTILQGLGDHPDKYDFPSENKWEILVNAFSTITISLG